MRNIKKYNKQVHTTKKNQTHAVENKLGFISSGERESSIYRLESGRYKLLVVKIRSRI